MMNTRHITHHLINHPIPHPINHPIHYPIHHHIHHPVNTPIRERALSASPLFRRFSVAFPLLLLSLLFFLLPSCGLTSLRSSQDWSNVTDQRFFKTCHVGNYGSGVLIAYQNKKAHILTCTHLVSNDEWKTIHLFNPKSQSYQSYRGRVILKTHPHKEDLAIIECENLDLDMAPFKIQLATSLSQPDQNLTLLNTAFGAEEKPFSLNLPAFEYDHKVSTVIPDKDGQKEWTLKKVLLHGGVQQANSGSPVFKGNDLVGLVESSPGFAVRNNVLVHGIVVSSPNSVRKVLDSLKILP